MHFKIPQIATQDKTVEIEVKTVKKKTASKSFKNQGCVCLLYVCMLKLKCYIISHIYIIFTFDREECLI